MRCRFEAFDESHAETILSWVESPEDPRHGPRGRISEFRFAGTAVCLRLGNVPARSSWSRVWLSGAGTRV